jgi:hypothetical protein
MGHTHTLLGRIAVSRLCELQELLQTATLTSLPILLHGGLHGGMDLCFTFRDGGG